MFRVGSLSPREKMATKIKEKDDKIAQRDRDRAQKILGRKTGWV